MDEKAGSYEGEQEATDWRGYIRRKPFAMVAAAFGIGLGMALLFGKHRP